MNYPFTAGDVPVPFHLIYSPEPDTASQYDCKYQNNQVTKWSEEYPFYPYGKQ